MEQQLPTGPLGTDVAVTHILVVTDPVRSREFWVGVLGAELYREYAESAPCCVSLARGCCWSAGAGRPPTNQRLCSRLHPMWTRSATP